MLNFSHFHTPFNLTHLKTILFLINFQCQRFSKQRIKESRFLPPSFSLSFLFFVVSPDKENLRFKFYIKSQTKRHISHSQKVSSCVIVPFSLWLVSLRWFFRHLSCRVFPQTTTTTKTMPPLSSSSKKLQNLSTTLPTCKTTERFYNNVVSLVRAIRQRLA